MLLAGDTASSNPGRLALESPWVSLGYADTQQQPKSIIFHFSAKQTKHKQNHLLRGYFECMDGVAAQATAAAVCARPGLRQGLSVLENGDAEGGV